jgi:hypothetical protein
VFENDPTNSRVFSDFLKRQWEWDMCESFLAEVGSQKLYTCHL